MDYSEFEHYVNRADEQAAKNFPRYKFKLRAFALLGYLVILGMIVAVVGLIGGLGALAFVSPALLFFLVKKKIIFVLIPMLWIMVRSLWVKLEPPKGYELTREKFPGVFKELDGLSSELDSLKVHTVLLTPEMNAAVVQTPKLGILGWQENTLFLGLELMLSLTSDQVRAVVAHELGHLSGNHSKFNGWIYRIRESWARLMNGMMAQDNLGARMMAKFFGWYAPRFAAYSFPLARNNEYEADLMAASLTNPSAIGEALINVHVVAPYLEENYWQNYFEKADTSAVPEIMPWAGLNQFLQSNTDPKLQQRLDQVLQIETDHSDTHPSLKDRLAALNISASLPATSGDTAAKQWLGDQYESVISEFDADWFETNEEPWRNRFEYVQSSNAKLVELRQADPTIISNEDLWEFARLEGEFGEASQAMKALAQYRERRPEDHQATYLLACHKMNDKDDDCLDLFEEVLDDPELAYNACSHAYQYLHETNRQDQAERWRAKAESANTVLEEAQAERDKLAPGEALEKANFNHENVQAVVAKLKRSGLIKKAWIAQKIVKHYPETPAIAVAVIGKGFSLSAKSLQTTLAEEFEKHDLWIIPKSGDYKPLAKSIIKIGDRVV